MIFGMLEKTRAKYNRKENPFKLHTKHGSSTRPWFQSKTYPTRAYHVSIITEEWHLQSMNCNMFLFLLNKIVTKMEQKIPNIEQYKQRQSIVIHTKLVLIHPCMLISLTRATCWFCHYNLQDSQSTVNNLFLMKVLNIKQAAIIHHFSQIFSQPENPQHIDFLFTIKPSALKPYSL